MSTPDSWTNELVSVRLRLYSYWELAGIFARVLLGRRRRARICIMSDERANTWISLVVFLSFLLSAGYAFWHRIEPTVDAGAYDQIAINIRDGFGFREERAGNIEFDTSIIRVGPAYEFFLAGVYALFGHRYEAAWILQAFLHALTAYLLYLIARRVFPEEGRKIGLIAAALFGLHPDLIEISALLMTETFYLFLIVLALWWFVRVSEDPRAWRYTLFLSFSLALAVLSRPPVLLFIPVILWLYAARRQYARGAAFLTLLIAFLAPWSIRNFAVYRQFIPTTLVGEYNLWVGNTLTARGGQISGGYNPATDYGTRYGYSPFAAEARRQFRAFVTAHPTRFLRLTALRSVRYMSLIRPMGFWFYERRFPQLLFVGASLASIAALFVLGFSGIGLALKAGRGILLYFAVLALTAPLVLLPAVVESRYRFQIYPFLALFGGYLAAVCFSRTHHPLRPAARKMFLGASAILIGISVIDGIAFFSVVMERLRALL